VSQIYPGEVFANIADFDAGIRQLIPRYDEMLEVVCCCVPRSARYILDLGCGTGELSLKLLERCPDAIVVAVDYSHRAIAQAKSKIKTAGYEERWTSIAMDFGEWALGKTPRQMERKFDACVSSLAIHHLSNEMKLKLFDRIGKSLKDGGSFWNADPVVIELTQLSEAYQQVREDWAIAQGTTIAQVRAKLGQSNNYGYSSQDRLATLEEHLQWLKMAGFKTISVPWKYYGLAIFGGLT
jgi:tRNA (cmo5U34)-methyltransferase